MTIEIPKAQAQLFLDVNEKVERAQRDRSMVLSTILAAHGIQAGTLLTLETKDDSDVATLKVRVAN